MNDKKYLELAINLAKESKEPIGCGSVLVNDLDEVIASNFNSQRADGLTAAHAEMKSIADANRKMGRKLKGVTAYGNCEPCTMCLTALIFAGVDRIVFVHYLNDLVKQDQQISINSFNFITNFRYQPVIEQISL